MRHRWMSLTGLVVVVMACTTQARAELAASPDQTWMLDGSRVQDVIATDGTVFVGGRFSAAVSPDGTVNVPAENLVALDDVTGEPVWTQHVTSPSGDEAMVWDLDLSGDGTTLFVCGTFDAVGSDERSNVAAVDAATGTVLPWRPKGVPACRSIERAPNAVYVGTGHTVRALGLDGSEQWAVRTDGSVLTLEWHREALIAGGRFETVDDLSRTMAARIDAAGNVDDTWALDPVPVDVEAEGVFAIDLVVRDSGLFLAAGGADFVAAYDQETGSLRWWTDASGSVQTLAFADPTTLVIGGHFQWMADADTRRCGDNQDPNEECASRMRLAAVSGSDGSLTHWGPRVEGAYTGVWALDVDALGRLHLGGAFTTVADREQRLYARIAPAVAATVPSAAAGTPPPA
jgi:outer membrane protein assembly factor BamB